MRFYGAGSLEDIRRCTELGVEGILTNPQGFEAFFGEEMTLSEITEAIVEVTDLPLFMQIHGKTSEELVKRGEELHEISSQVGFKIIADEKGFLAIKALQKKGISCIATSLFTLSQAAIANMVGAYGICPFVSRSRAIGMDPYLLLSGIVKGYRALPHPPQIIAVSLKDVSDVQLALSTGVDAVGMRYPLLKEVMEHPLSKKAEILFAKNWAKIKGEDSSYLIDDGEGVAE